MVMVMKLDEIAQDEVFVITVKELAHVFQDFMEPDANIRQLSIKKTKKSIYLSQDKKRSFYQ